MTSGSVRGPAARNLVAALLTGAFAGSAAALVLVGWAQVAQGPVGAAGWFAATAAVAVVVPLTRPLAERGADRFVFGADGDPSAVLARFVDEISGAIAVDDVLPQLARAAASATHSPTGQATVRLADGDAFRQTWPSEMAGVGEEVTVSLEHGGRVVGELGVQADREVADVDRAQLQRFSGPAGLALANVGLTFDLRRQLAQEQALLRQLRDSRQRLLTAAADQRARFSVDVQREVVQVLGRAEQALAAVATGDGEAVLRARGDAQQALDSLRALASSVYEVTLAERGVVAAVQRYQELHPEVSWSSGAPALPRLPRGVEEAAYFALLAVVGALPSGAGPVAVDLELRTATLWVLLAGPRAVPDSAIQLARDRVEAAGGALTVRDWQALDLELWLPALDEGSGG
ncbi:hypothetical protein ACPPVT_06410 [Angustibacter sp. McL0619]|uniref:hypothetical protein n=1 Tax=Angustibacter sp. McL0619 TaxID=3415676 RepID=UPI003CF882AC